MCALLCTSCSLFDIDMDLEPLGPAMEQLDGLGDALRFKESLRWDFIGIGKAFAGWTSGLGSRR
jgi:hypothetical protein